MNFAVKSIFCWGVIVVVIMFLPGKIFRTQPYKTPRVNERAKRVSERAIFL